MKKQMYVLIGFSVVVICVSLTSVLGDCPQTWQHIAQHIARKVKESEGAHLIFGQPQHPIDIQQIGQAGESIQQMANRLKMQVYKLASNGIKVVIFAPLTPSDTLLSKELEYQFHSRIDQLRVIRQFVDSLPKRARTTLQRRWSCEIRLLDEKDVYKLLWIVETGYTPDTLPKKFSGRKIVENYVGLRTKQLMNSKRAYMNLIFFPVMLLYASNGKGIGDAECALSDQWSRLEMKTAQMMHALEKRGLKVGAIHDVMSLGEIDKLIEKYKRLLWESLAPLIRKRREYIFRRMDSLLKEVQISIPKGQVYTLRTVEHIIQEKVAKRVVFDERYKKRKVYISDGLYELSSLIEGICLATSLLPRVVRDVVFVGDGPKLTVEECKQVTFAVVRSGYMGKLIRVLLPWIVPTKDILKEHSIWDTTWIMNGAILQTKRLSAQQWRFVRMRYPTLKQNELASSTLVIRPAIIINYHYFTGYEQDKHGGVIKNALGQPIENWQGAGRLIY